MINVDNKKIIEKLNHFDINFLEQINLLELFVKEMLIDQVIKDISFSNEQISDFLKVFIKNQNIKSQNEFDNFLNKRNITYKLFLIKFIRSKKIEKFFIQNFKLKSRNYFLENKNSFNKVTYTLIRLKDYQLSKELYFQIEGGEENINQLATKYSIGDEKNSKGIIGPVPINQGHPLLVQKILSCNEGDLLEPFNIEGTWIILKLERYINATYNEILEFKICNEFFEKYVLEKSHLIIKEIRLIKSF